MDAATGQGRWQPVKATKAARGDGGGGGRRGGGRLGKGGGSMGQLAVPLSSIQVTSPLLGGVGGGAPAADKSH